jgi:hypothetical protein
VSPQRRALSELRQTAPCHFTEEARKKAGKVGPNSDLALLCGLCPKVVLSGWDSRFSCDLAYGSDEVPISIQPSRKSAWSFDVTFGSFTRANARQAVVISPIDEHYKGVRLFLMERSDGRWVTLNTISLLESVSIPPIKTLRDDDGLDVLIGTFKSKGDASQWKVRAFRFNDTHVQRAVLAPIASCSELSPKETITNDSRQNHFSAAIRVTGVTVIIEGKACTAIDESSRAADDWVELSYVYDGAQFHALPATRSWLHLDTAEVQWEKVDWELGTLLGR